MARPRLEPGQTIDGFVVGRMIHAGGMAMLYEANRSGEETPLLMKVPRLLEGEDPAAIVSFEMEQMIMPRLKGPHVPRHIANGDFSKQPFIVMERVPGESLVAQIEHLPLPCERVAALGAAIADALDALHRQHVVHLDVDFVKRITVQEVTPRGLDDLGRTARTLARLESLDAHANAVSVRLEVIERESLA